MWQRYKQKDSFLSAVSDGLQNQGVPASAASAVLDGISRADDNLRAEEAGPRGVALNLRIGSWVLRDDDLPIIQTLGTTATALAATLATGGIAWPAAAAALTSFADLCWKAWRKGASLSSTELIVYGFVKAHGPITVERLSTLLQEAKESLSVQEIEVALRNLAEMELNNGELLAMTSLENDGVWVARNF